MSERKPLTKAQACRIMDCIDECRQRAVRGIRHAGRTNAKTPAEIAQDILKFEDEITEFEQLRELVGRSFDLEKY